MKDLERAIGFSAGDHGENYYEQLHRYVNLKLSVNNLPFYERENDRQFFESSGDLLKKARARAGLLKDYLCPIDRRIQEFIDAHLNDVVKKGTVRIPRKTVDLDRHGLARAMSLAPDKQNFFSDEVKSYRIEQGVLHNPTNDRRTTAGVFHIAEGGLPIPADKKAVPKTTFALLFAEALKPPKSLQKLPYTTSQKNKAESFVSLMIRPIVCPEIPGVMPEKRMEIRFFAPGSLVSNLDFVESIFGNAGDPHLPENDAGIDVEHFSGHTGFVLLAPHIKYLKKKDLGLPHFDDATPRQKKDGMCWKSPDELYNEGQPFKITCRTDEGVITTILADNYFGYCKKEVKTQIGYASNLLGLSEEEHAGGAIAFARRRLPDLFKESSFKIYNENPKLAFKFSLMKPKYASFIDFKKEGYGVDKNFSQIIYLPEDAEFNLAEQKVTWSLNKITKELKLLPRNIYIYPSGFKVHMEQHPTGAYWRLIGTRAEGSFIHKPCTVSGGGKSEISKSIEYSMIYKRFFIKDLEDDLKRAEEVISKNYLKRFKSTKGLDVKKEGRPFLSAQRTLGSVIKLLTPSAKYTADYNKWVASIPNHIRSLVFIIKHHQTFLGKEWKSHFSVDKLDGVNGNELKFKTVRHLVSSYVRIGMDVNKDWRIFQLRPDYIAAEKLQMEDDITSSVVYPSKGLKNIGKDAREVVKIVENCEYRFFQRPDDAIVRGFDVQAEIDLSKKDTFISNFEPLTTQDAKDLKESVVDFAQFTVPMQNVIKKACEGEDGKYFVCSAKPRIVDGAPTKNVRYLQTRQDLVSPINRYIAEVGLRFVRKVPADEKPLMVVNSVIPGRRLNPQEGKTSRNLAVFNPIHYQELPELFMEFMCSLTGKSPSTTGAGSEGALTKGPFNALRPTIDLNNALVSFILTGYAGFSTAANYVGKMKVDHDVSLLIPEVWCLMREEEKDPSSLIDLGCLEKVSDFKHKGKTILASRLGYRITESFVQLYLGRVFNNPRAVFSDEMLKPELQGLDEYVDGINNIVENQQLIAKTYLSDGSADDACPPLKALIEIMANGKSSDGYTIDAPEFRALFTREYLLKSDWYHERLFIKQQKDIKLWDRHVSYLEKISDQYQDTDLGTDLHLKKRLSYALEMKKTVHSMSYLKSLSGTIGADTLGAF